MRVGYDDSAFNESDLAPTPLEQFTVWLDEAIAANIAEPNAMVLSTVDAHQPTSRTVLLKAADNRGFVFYTNLTSRKGRDLVANPHAALVFPWIPMQRQVIVCGSVEQVPRAEAREYFQSRPRGSQLGAWASHQSSVLANRAALDEAYRAAADRWQEPNPIELPDHWGGFVVMATSVEFWRGRQSRLHDRLRYVSTESTPTLASGGAGLGEPSRWQIERLSP
jgi:pyridoxamine 5'-phosphate oxidase